MTKGFIYIAKNEAMPGLLKIGYTEKVPSSRVDELFTTGVPEPFEIEYYCLVDNVKNLERTIHKRLEAHRNSKCREFFRIDLEQALHTISSLCTPEHEWHATKKSNKGINAYSRHFVESEEMELEKFVEIIQEQSLEKYITEVFYDSNASICFFKFSDDVVQFGPIANKIHAIALETISQFEWFGCIHYKEEADFPPI